MHFERAVEIAAQAHRGQTDKEGETYLLHPLRVALSVSPAARCVAVLHDVVEDSDWTLEALAADGLAEDELAAIGLLTRSDDGTYGEFIERIASAPAPAGNSLARPSWRTSTTTSGACPIPTMSPGQSCASATCALASG